MEKILGKIDYLLNLIILSMRSYIMFSITNTPYDDAESRKSKLSIENAFVLIYFVQVSEMKRSKNIIFCLFYKRINVATTGEG